MNRNDQQFIAQKIRSQYIEKQPSELDELRRIDTKVKRPVNVFSYIFGSVSAIIMGAGMSLVMTDLAVSLGVSADTALILGVAMGVIGGVIASLAYPVYNATLNRMRKKVSPEIIRLTDELMK